MFDVLSSRTPAPQNRYFMGGILERNIFKALRDWKDDPARKPLLLRGARQVGKTLDPFRITDAIFYVATII